MNTVVRLLSFCVTLAGTIIATGCGGPELTSVSGNVNWQKQPLPDGEIRFSDPVSQSFSSMAWNGSALLIVTFDGNTVVTDVNGRVLHHGAHLNVNDYGATSASGRGTGIGTPLAKSDVSTTPNPPVSSAK